MLNLHNLKPLHNLKLRLLLLSIAAFLVFAGPAVTLQDPSKALVAETPNEVLLSTSSLTPVYSGAVTSATCTTLKGWLDWIDESTPGYVHIYINGVFQGTIPANRCLPGRFACDSFTYTIPSSLKNGEELLVEVKDANTGMPLTGSPKTIRCGAMLFPGSTPPGPVTSVSGEGKTWEQANQLTSIESGTITHIRFWKVPEECGTHTGSIWSDTGALLRSQPFTNETPSGWQTLKLTSPLQITAGTKYRVSYNVNCYGGKIISGLTSPYSREPLTAWRGFYTTPSGKFPNTSSVSNFLADVMLNVPQ
jgi:hypothetical protein